jgi:hypothetical protein
VNLVLAILSAEAEVTLRFLDCAARGTKNRVKEKLGRSARNDSFVVQAERQPNRIL